MNEPRYPRLERITAFVLVLVLLSLAAMALAAWQPGWMGWLPQDVQVWAAAVLLTVALVLVSAVALLQTRS
jgi:hypothetical protein